MRGSVMPPAAWSGSALLAAGFGVFHGTVGAHALHAHSAHQLVVAFEGEVGVAFPTRPMRAAGISIPAGLQHCVCAEQALLVYIDPLTPEGAALCAPSAMEAQPLDAGLCAKLRLAAGDGQCLRSVLRDAFGLPQPAPPDPRMASVAGALRAGLSEGNYGRHELAALANISPSRFSHWFVEQTGLPLRNYRKWLRLELALHRLAQGGNLTAAAHAAGFSDSAHLSRTFREMFGMSPAALLRGITLDSSFVQAA
ncbi:AraC family transcriptional regulator [Pseudoduganella violaceinigra]|uniref:AraC family transcriptional regulator n=1 Tax=Pseudoduganella violaceinigra TaxID=246602 RepID=UPI00041137C7|nr:AraC family transcriptional regulator [Pseudoduganella violaceinigra]